jgi:hypothetical protein
MLAEQVPDKEKKTRFVKEAMHLIATHVGT